MDVSTPLDATAGTAEDGMIDDLKIFSKNFKKVLTSRFKCGTISTRLREPSKQNHFQSFQGGTSS